MEGDPAAVSAVAGLLGALPQGSGPPALRFLLRAGARARRPRLERAFFHGVVEGFLDGGDVLVWDGASLVRVRAGGGEIEVQVAPASLRERHVFTHVLMLLALVLAMRWRSVFHVHAAALVTGSGQGVLVAGGSGAGKSTLTLALLEAGCGYLGDDAVLARLREGEPEILALPRVFHVAPRTAAAFPRIGPLLGEILPSGEKRCLDPRRAWPGREAECAGSPEILLLPAVEDRPRSEAEPVGAAEGLGALIESSTHIVVDGLPGAAEHLEVLRAIADGARAYRVRLGRDLLDQPAATAARLVSAG